jgi:hypothetical protein
VVWARSPRSQDNPAWLWQGLGLVGNQGGRGMTYPEDARVRYSLDEFVGRLRDFIDRRRSEKSDSSDDCAIVVTDVGLDLCCVVDTESGKEVECTNVLDILKPE